MSNPRFVILLWVVVVYFAGIMAGMCLSDVALADQQLDYGWNRIYGTDQSLEEFVDAHSCVTAVLEPEFDATGNLTGIRTAFPHSRYYGIAAPFLPTISGQYLYPDTGYIVACRREFEG